jgi:hypothetical protein
MHIDEIKNDKNQQLSYVGYQQCCSMGMYMSTIDTLEEAHCIAEAYFKSK